MFEHELGFFQKSNPKKPTMSQTIIKADIEALNAEFEPLGFQERISRLYEYFPVDQVLFTSSFGTKSVVMLTLVSRPLIDITEGEFLFHLEKDKLPRHPLEAKGYGSIGCHHCTRPGQGRAGRWAGKDKDECGLHVS